MTDDAEEWRWLNAKAGYVNPPKSASTDLTKASAEAHRSHKHPAKDYWDKAGIFGLWAAAAVGLYAIISSGQDAEQQRKVMEDQINVMKEQFRPVMNLQLADDHDAAEVRLTPTWTNEGGGEGLDFTGWSNHKLFDKNEIPNVAFFDEPLYSGPMSTPVSVEPHANTYQLTAHISREDAQSIARGNKIGFIFGYVQWKSSVFPGQTFFKHYCLILPFTEGLTSIIYTLPVVYKPGCNYAGTLK